MLLIVILSGVIALTLMTKRSLEFLHIIQLEGYNSNEYLKWIKENKDKIYIIKSDRTQAKKPFVFTSRAKRLYAINILLNVLLDITFVFIVIKLIPTMNVYLFAAIFMVLLAFLFVTYLFQGYISLMANIISSPIEKEINNGYYNRAKEKIKRREDLIVVGVTGSFGKTSTKFILGTILGEKYNVLNTPESYNTPMGLSKVINNDLTKEHEVFIAELGARNIGDIREVSELVQPNIGVITSIGPTHIETFKNIDNIMKTKFELIEELSIEGLAVFNYDNEYIRKLAEKTFKEKGLYGMKDIEELDFYAEDIKVSEKGSTFTIKDKKGNSILCTTKLLGKHNIYNILAAVTVARSLGLSFEEIKSGIGKIEPIRHRLNIMTPDTGVIIIDDAFNSNPIGAKAALDVLSEFKEAKKIIVTPGMVELGSMEEEANREFGINIGKVCDYVILVGEERTQPIYEGLMEANFNKNNIYVVNSLDESTEYIGKLAKAKDVVLFENDLPDHYN